MGEMPIVKIEIEALRRNVCHALLGKNNEINDYIIKSLEKQLTEEWVIAGIDAAVQKCLKDAIEGIANNYQMRSAITDLISGVVAEKLVGRTAQQN